MAQFKVEKLIGNRALSIETGRVARQADGAVLVQYGETIVLVTAVSASEEKGNVDFLPLTVDYREKTYAAGKFPGGFFKREGRPSQKEILTMRLIDRPIRPLFPDTYFREVQVMSIVLSADKENDPDILAMVGASAALSISSIPFSKPTGSVRVGQIEGKFIINPTHAELAQSSMDIVVSGTEDAVMMVEASAKEIPEEQMVDAIMFGHAAIKEIITLQHELIEKCGKEKQIVAPSMMNKELMEEVKQKYYTAIVEKNLTPGKGYRKEALDEILAAIINEYCVEGVENAPTPKEIKAIFETVETIVVREQIVSKGLRPDSRGLKDIRPITCEVGILPRVHGSALFTRGETQAIVVVTLGTTSDEQKVDGLEDEYSKKFMLDYNFPPFCVGETKPLRGPGRREIGHGALAERALAEVLPPPNKFPYTTRVVSDITESNGSSSMASVCGGTLALMDAGVPIKAPVAGIAMGLVKEENSVCILSDILGTEDHLGDMDFKVAGTAQGVTALQMDIKIAGITEKIMRDALAQAREGRLHILQELEKVIEKPREKISVYAPKIVQIKINPEKIGMIIGPGGKNIKKIQEETGAKIEIEDDGTVIISATLGESAEKAKTWIENMTKEVEVGKTYKGKVLSIKEYGAFVEIIPGHDGLVHISELSYEYVEKAGDVVEVGQEIMIKVIGIDDQKRVKLSRKAALKESEQPLTPKN
ncbi:MAG: polyribonucleotide nucleotidyltransferase [Candidatus Kuenenia stuttgartiensis]|jgi:polyribonucleotide nucleotidyltransferase|uniref:Polyribonucleotide nucleotidyltransferase n=1 Tax=Kuenenia stuttgartiensis TaxID=174633 RepID=A0A2C9CGM3_KUEST|nr:MULTISPECIES: polyribonucleotide nucleotidyltransferase [Kuenenia]MBE7546115.1 polyribonucleotide nucleotidyltransferase [Planctomycetia bacterium]MBW7942934.1 polyribonucleotide nucleotidyltransferase [Candidatus Kuenenia stuttgartiensis]MBZ0191321.1 polyribonucleotide nucleotidyltransferase [Candidatus Kuenenia stuttgartiensis]MCF6153270.1 polyribonucleotide nucleotidyltransferase [Candidatus Kuenenia stuttgartiensis]MCL4726397.1 polyribonucleotide nucleotidyltransferase [Candidatus Kuene